MAKPGPKPGFKRPVKPHDLIHHDDGEHVGILLTNRPVRVWLHQDDYAGIVSAYGTKLWSWHGQGNHARLKPDRGSSVSIGRLIMKLACYPGYRDGDRLNLRKENLTTRREAFRKARVVKAAPDVAASSVAMVFPKRPPSVPQRGPGIAPRTPSAVVATVKRTRPTVV